MFICHHADWAIHNCSDIATRDNPESQENCRIIKYVLSTPISQTTIAELLIEDSMYISGNYLE